MIRPEELRKPLYRWLREGERGSQVGYYFAAICFWLLSARCPYVGTRIIEIPWVLTRIRELDNSLKILQVGDVVLKKALDKHEEVLVDLDAEETPKSGLKVHKADIRSVSLPRCYFDVAVSISTIEHIGLQELEFTDGDKVAVDIIARALKPEGLFLFTVPFGKPIARQTFRVYDHARLKFILGDKFELLKSRFLVWSKLKWRDMSPEEAEKVSFLKNNTSMNLGICLIEARKRKC